MNNIKVLGIQNVFSIGNRGCKHEWVYNTPTSMTFTVPAIISQERICDCCGRLEIVQLEGRQARFELDKFVALKERFDTSTEVGAEDA